MAVSREQQSVHTLVYTALIVTGDTLSVSVTICSVGAGAEKYEDMEKLSLVFLVPLLLMPVLTILAAT